MRFLVFSLNIFLFSVFSLAFNLSSAAFAYERISNPYQASVLLDDRGGVSRDKAISEGLEQVLIRYSGYSGVADFAGVEAELQNAQRYVIEYGVETVVVPADDQIAVKKTDALWVRYNANLIEALVESLELPIWPTLRPTISYIVVTELWGEPYIPTPIDFPAIDTHMKKLFDFRGLVASRIDDSGRRAVSADSLWNLDGNVLQQIKSQAGTDVLAVIRAVPQYDGSYELDFVVVGEGNETQLTRKSQTLFSALDSGFDFYIDHLSAELSFLGGTNTEQDLYIDVAGVRSYSEYKTVLNQISGLEQVLSVRMSNAQDEGVSYLVRYQSNRELLIEAIIEITGLKPLERLLEEANVYIDADLPAQLGTNTQPLIFVYPRPTFINTPDILNHYSSNRDSLNNNLSPDDLNKDSLSGQSKGLLGFERSIEPIDALSISVEGITDNQSDN